jgi:hypothetical protein
MRGFAGFFTVVGEQIECGEGQVFLPSAAHVSPILPRQFHLGNISIRLAGMLN